AAALAQLSRWLASFALHAPLRAELAVCAAGRAADDNRAGAGALALAGTTHRWPQRRAGYPHYDLWRDFYAAGRADSRHRRIRQGLQLCRAVRPQHGVVETSPETRLAREGIAAGRRLVRGGIGRLRLYRLAVGGQRIRPSGRGAGCALLVHVAFPRRTSHFF